MAEADPSSAETQRLSRRQFLVRTGTGACGVAFAGAAAPLLGARGKRPQAIAANAWVTLHDSGEVTILCPGIELGQGAFSTLPRFLAEELDADWRDVRVLPAPSHEKTYGNPLFWGIQITAGSRTCLGYYDTLRIAGAQARYVLMEAAARSLRVPLDELTTAESAVIHARSGRRLRYAELVPTVTVPATFPAFVASDYLAQPADALFGDPPPAALAPSSTGNGVVALKSRPAYRLVGLDAPRQDIPEKVTGAAQYGIDAQVPGMLYAMVETGDVSGSVPGVIDDAEARAEPGISAILRLPTGVAIVGADMVSVRTARAKLKITWQAPPGSRYDSEAAMAAFSRTAADPGRLAVRVFEQGKAEEVEAALVGGGGVGTVSFEARSPFVYHAPIEPQNATLTLSADGKSAEAWHGTQWPSLDQKEVGAILGIPPEAVTINTLFPGGSFGRRQEPGAILDAARIAKVLRKPIKVIWTREDDLRRNPHRQALLCRIEAALDGTGRISAMRHRVVADSWFARKFPDWFEQYQKSDPGNWTGALHDYAVPLQVVEAVTQRDTIDVCYMRGIGVSQVKFAQETLIDRIATEHGHDPLDYRLGMLKNVPRGVAVLEKVAAMSGWRDRHGQSGAPSRALGLAYTPYSDAHAALVAEVSVDRASGAIRVHRVWCAVDVGFAAQPAIVASQIEGGIVQGLSIALLEQVTYRNGVAEQTNFGNYQMLRMSQTPEISIEILSTEHAMAGAGEIGTMQIAPAVNNAIAALIGSPMTGMPMLPQDVLRTIATGTQSVPAAANGAPSEACAEPSRRGSAKARCPGSPWSPAPSKASIPPPTH